MFHQFLIFVLNFLVLATKIKRKIKLQKTSRDKITMEQKQDFLKKFTIQELRMYILIIYFKCMKNKVNIINII